MSKNSSFDIGSFLSKIANDNSPASGAVLKSLQEKLEKEKAERLENKIKSILSRIQEDVSEIRRIRKMEKMIKNNIAELENIARKIVNGDEVEGY